MSPLIADFIDLMTTDGELTDWTVALIGKEKAEDEDEAEIGGHKVAIGDLSRQDPTTGTSPGGREAWFLQAP